MLRIAFCVTVLCALGLSYGAPALAQEDVYLLGPEDVISINVWDHPELSRTLAVRADGKITLPPLGDIPAAGMTTTELARAIEDGIRNTLRLSVQATVAVLAFNSRKVYVSGQVLAPGAYNFERIPTLLDVLSQAGGLSSAADLSRVRIVRQEGGKTETLTTDLSNAFTSGDLSGVPALRPGDHIFVPGIGLGGGPAAGAEVVYVLGEVTRPGAYTATAGMDILQALTLAGGFTPMGDLARVDVLATAGADDTYRIRVDLQSAMKDGGVGVPLSAGDIVLVPAKKPGAGGIAWGAFREVLGVSRDLLDAILIYDYFDKR